MKIPYKFYDKCYSCNQCEHYIDECNLIHYIPDKITILQKHCYSENQERLYIMRRKKIKKIKYNKIDEYELVFIC